MFENGKPDIVLKTVKGFNLKRTPFIILILENSLNVGQDPKNPIVEFVNLCPFLTLSFKHGPSVSFGTNVPCSLFVHFIL